MRHFFLACACLIFFTVAAQTQTVNSANLLRQFLDLPAPPPRDEKSLPVTKTNVVREPGFYDKNKIPPDDAPIGDLVEYWSTQSRNFSPLRYKIKPSQRTLERLLEFCEENPEQIARFLKILPSNPSTAEIVKRFYDKLLESETAEGNVYQIKAWLLYNSIYFVDELSKNAEQVKDKNEYVTNQNDLLALARVDWDKALPILERIIADKTQPVSATLAKWAFYARALEAGEEIDISKYRRQLQDVVEDRAMLPGARDLAFDALVSEKDWDGRDDWYVSLFSDETLFDLKVNGQTYTGLTTLILYSPPEKYVTMMTALVANKNPAIRRAAIKNLLSALNNGSIEAARALLPWAASPNWASDFKEGRSAFIRALGNVDLPESVPVLITILMNEEEFRPTVAEALARYKDSRAVPALRVALAAEKNPYRRMVFVRALDECGGLSDDEKMSALELFAEAASTPEGMMKFTAQFYAEPVESSEKPQTVMPVALSIGNFVAQQTEPTDGLVVRAIERLKTLRKTKPATAEKLSEIMQKWRGRLIFIERLRQIKEGEANLEMILTALAQRREIREKLENEIFAMRVGAGVGRGIAACLAEDAADLHSVLRQQTDTDARIAVLGCARLLRAALPVAEVGALLKSPNKTLALAAERYLESEDSVEARTMILAQRPGEAVILGARPAFIPDMKKIYMSESLSQIFQSVTGRGLYGMNFPLMDKNEVVLREEIKTNPELLAIYGILQNDATGQLIIRVFKDKVVFTHNEDAARYRERVLTVKEYEDFYRLIINEKIDSTASSLGSGSSGEVQEFVMFGKNGGRRVFFLNNLVEGSALKKLVERFASFGEGNLKLHYRLADKIQGLEVLLADEKFPARAVWRNGGDLRVAVEDKDKEAEIAGSLEQQFEIEDKAEVEEDNYEQYEQIRESQEKRRRDSKYAHYFWRGFENGALGSILPQPLEMPYLYDETQVPEIPGFDNEPRGWQLRAGDFEIRVSHNESGLYKVSRAQAPVMFKEGNYHLPVVTPDGKWVVASKVKESWQEPKNLVRINLQTGKEFPVDLAPADALNALTFLPAHNKILVYRAKGNRYYGYRSEDNDEESEMPVNPNLRFPGRKNEKNPSPNTPEFYLLDAATGTVQLVKGEFRPLEELTYRPLQPTGAPDEFWAALYDKKTRETAVGRYNTKTFTFQPSVKLPEIKLSSMDIWVDEKEAKIYFVYEGHVLTVPLLGK